MQNTRRDSLIVPYLAMLALGGVVAHLTLEFAGMGADAAGVTADGTHRYLFAFALAALFVLVAWALCFRSASSNLLDLRRRLQLGVDALPWRGRGARFLAVTVTAELGIAAVTQIAEGSPVYGHDVFGGAVAAIAVAIVTVTLRNLIFRSLPALTGALAALFVGNSGAPALRFLHIIDLLCKFATDRMTVALFSRPPPSFSLTP